MLFGISINGETVRCCVVPHVLKTKVGDDNEICQIPGLIGFGFGVHRVVGFLLSINQTHSIEMSKSSKENQIATIPRKCCS